MDINTDSSSRRTRDADMAPNSSLGSEDTVDIPGSIGHIDLHSLSSSTTLGCQHGLDLGHLCGL